MTPCVQQQHGCSVSTGGESLWLAWPCFPSQQQPESDAADPKQNGFTLPLGHRQSGCGMPATNSITAVSQPHTTHVVLRRLSLITC